MKYNKKNKSKIEEWLNDFLWSKKIVKTAGHVGRTPYKLPTPHLRYPFMDRFLLGTRNNIMFVNTSLTIEETAKGLFLAAKILRDGGRLLILDTRPESPFFLHVFENNLHTLPSAISFSGCRWVGGTVSNWKKISKRVFFYSKISPPRKIILSRNDIEYSWYRKMKDAYPSFLERKEGQIISRLHHLKKKKKWRYKKSKLTRYPDLIFVVNPFDSRHVINEANLLKIPVMALVDVDTNLDGIKIPIPINSDTAFWVYFCIGSLIRLAHFLQIYEKIYFPSLQPYRIKKQKPFPSGLTPWNKREIKKREQTVENRIFSKNSFRDLSKPQLAFKEYAGGKKNQRKS